MKLLTSIRLLNLSLDKIFTVLTGLEEFQAVLVHGVQLYDTWRRDTIDEVPQCGKLQPSERSAAGKLFRLFNILDNCVV